MFSLTLFLTRLLSGLALFYITVGCLLFYREFLYNATAMGLPLPVPAGLALVVVCSVAYFTGSRITAQRTLRSRKNQFGLFPRGAPRQ